MGGSGRCLVLPASPSVLNSLDKLVCVCLCAGRGCHLQTREACYYIVQELRIALESLLAALIFIQHSGALEISEYREGEHGRLLTCINVWQKLGNQMLLVQRQPFWPIPSDQPPIATLLCPPGSWLGCPVLI